MHHSNSRRFIILPALAFFVIAACAGSTFAQIGGLGGLGDKLKKKTPNLLGDKAPITTSLPDAKWGDASKDGFTPREAGRSLMTLQRTPNGGFVLQPGYFSMQDAKLLPESRDTRPRRWRWISLRAAQRTRRRCGDDYRAQLGKPS